MGWESNRQPLIPRVVEKVLIGGRQGKARLVTYWSRTLSLPIFCCLSLQTLWQEAAWDPRTFVDVDPTLSWGIFPWHPAKGWELSSDDLWLVCQLPLQVDVFHPPLTHKVCPLASVLNLGRSSHTVTQSQIKLVLKIAEMESTSFKLIMCLGPKCAIFTLSPSQ